jgi:hypothetical protein
VDVQAAMAVGGTRYAEELHVLGRFGPAEFTQTGGMCAALQVTLERGYLLVTDSEDSLPWDRDQLRGWGVGYYRTDDASDGPDAFVDSADTTPGALVALVRQCLQELASSRRS